jgi:hypothetical protein
MKQVELVIEPDGNVRAIYTESLDLTCLGSLAIRRGSHVEPTETGQWTADLSPCDGPVLGPFAIRSQAIDAEVDWLRKHWLAPKPA